LRPYIPPNALLEKALLQILLDELRCQRTDDGLGLLLVGIKERNRKCPIRAGRFGRITRHKDLYVMAHIPNDIFHC
jgi:hypothetical protein